MGKNCSKREVEDTLHSWAGIIVYLLLAGKEDKNSLEQKNV